MVKPSADSNSLELRCNMAPETDFSRIRLSEIHLVGIDTLRVDAVPVDGICIARGTPACGCGGRAPPFLVCTKGSGVVERALAYHGLPILLQTPIVVKVFDW